MSHTPGYEVDDKGRVFSITSNWRGHGIRMLIATESSHGYMRVRLTINGKRKSYFVHKLVAQKYLPVRPSEKHEIRHLDGNRKNNSAENLAWGTRKENAKDRELHGRTSRGKRHSEAIKRGLLHSIGAQS